MEKHSTKWKGFFLTVRQGLVGLIILCGGLLLADIPSFAASFNFSNTTPIVVPGSGTMGPASLYPSTISVSGLLGTVTNVNVSLFGLTHTFPDDLDILLVGPTGAKTMLMSDAGGSHNIYNVNLTFSAGAASGLANSSVISSGTYRPTNHGNSDSFPSPAPGGPYGSSLAVFNGLNPNGTWSLYVNDDQICDIGGIRGGWQLNIKTAGLAPVPEPSTWLLLSSGFAGLAAWRRRFARA